MRVPIPTSEQEEDRFKGIVKEAVKEWLDEQISYVGWWTMKTVFAFILIGILILVIKFR